MQLRASTRYAGGISCGVWLTWVGKVPVSLFVPMRKPEVMAIRRPSSLGIGPTRPLPKREKSEVSEVRPPSSVGRVPQVALPMCVC